MSALQPLTPDPVAGVVEVPIVCNYLRGGPVKYAQLTPPEALDLAAALVVAAKAAYSQRFGDAS